MSESLARQEEIRLFEMVRRSLVRITSDNSLEIYRDGVGWFRKSPNFHPHSSRARYQFGSRHQRTNIYRNRIFWIITNRQPIPEGYFVDHKDGDRTNDAPENLVLMLENASHLQGNEKQSETTLKQLCRWFRFVGEFGREPETETELLFVENAMEGVVL